jgi:hypothetical protein
VNQGKWPRTVDQTPQSTPWLVDSLSPVAAASLADNGNAEHAWLERGLSSIQHIALVGALFAGLLVGLFAADHLLDDVVAGAASSPQVPASHAVSPELHTDATDSSEPSGPAAESAAASREQPVPTPAVVQKPKRPHPARTQLRPRPRRPTPPHALPEQPSQDR